MQTRFSPVILFILLAAIFFNACNEDTLTSYVDTESVENEYYNRTQECDNNSIGSFSYVSDSAKIYYCNGSRWVPLLGKDGKDGSDGIDGHNGKDGVNGKNGIDGIKCTMEKNNKEYTLVCGETSAVINIAVELPDTCSIQNLKDSAYVVKCGDSTMSFIQGIEGADGKSCYQETIDNKEVKIICGDKVTTVATALCGSVSYDPKGRFFCYEDSLITRCDHAIYDIRKQFCNNGILVDRCKNLVYDLENQFCFDNSIYDNNDHFVFENNLYKKKEHFIFEDKLYSHEDFFIFDNKLYSHENSFVFGDGIYNRDDHFIFENNLYKHEDYFTFENNLYPTDEYFLFNSFPYKFTEYFVIDEILYSFDKYILYKDQAYSRNQYFEFQEQIYNQDDYFLSNDQLFDRENFIECSNGEVYDRKDYFETNGKIFNKNEFFELNGKVYDKSVFFESGNILYAHEDFIEFEGNAYSKNEYFLFDGKIYESYQYFEANDKIFSKDEYFIYNNNVYEVCGGNIFNPEKEYCEDDKIRTLCEGQKYDQTSHFCGDDNMLYRYVTIGEQTWMAENLRTPTSRSVQGKNPLQFAVGDTKQYGMLYFWTDAINLCPTGWHLPTFPEWQTLFNYVHSLHRNEGDLKSKTMNGTDYFGFSAEPAGIAYANGIPHATGESAEFWTATEGEVNQRTPLSEADRRRAVSIYIYNHDSRFSYISFGKEEYLRAVRCVKDETDQQ